MLLAVATLFLFANISWAQDGSAPSSEVRAPTAGECAELFPCDYPAKAAPRAVHRTQKRAPSYRTDPAVLRRLDLLETQETPAPVIQVAPTSECTEHSCPTPVAPVVHNHITVAAPRAVAEPPASNARFGLEAGGLATVHSSWWETSPGFYAAASFKWKRLMLGVRGNYERITFNDGSTVEDVSVEPVAGYELGRHSLRLIMTGGFGFWTTLEDWITPTCGRSSCGSGHENALSLFVEPRLALAVTRTVDLMFGFPFRWVSKTPDGDEWTLGLTAGVGLWTP